MGRPRLFKFQNVAYSVYTPVVVNDNNQVQCPACASIDVRNEYTVIKHGLIKEYDSTTYLCQCGFCSYSFCFSTGYIPESLVVTIDDSIERDGEQGTNGILG